METKPNFFKETIKFALLVLLIVVPVRLYIAQPFIVNGSSMDPTFASGQYLIIDEISYRFIKPSRGDVIVFRFPNNPKQFFIKRIIGLPEETVSFTDSTVQITSKDNPKSTVLNEPYLQSIQPPNFGYEANTSVRLAEDEFFVMGDNRLSSYDSRKWGPLKQDLIIGRALLRLYPVNSLSVYPGRFILDIENTGSQDI